MNRHPNVARLANDAAALVRVASPDDWQHGFVVVADRLPPGILALACGAGRGLADSYGLREGSAVVVDVWKLCRDVAAYEPAEAARVEVSALHEAAHALTTPDTTAEHATELLNGAGVAVPGYSALTVARHHSSRWALAFWLLTTRAAKYRPKFGRRMVDTVADQLAVYGFARTALEQLAVGVGDTEPLRERLAVGGSWDTLLSTRLPDDEQRAATIVAAGVAQRGTEVTT